MFPEFHYICPFCGKYFDSWENAIHQVELHMRECLDIDDSAASKVARTSIKAQLRGWTAALCDQIDEGKDYFEN